MLSVKEWEKQEKQNARWRSFVYWLVMIMLVGNLIMLLAK
jgi:hypothetical protein